MNNKIKETDQRVQLLGHALGFEDIALEQLEEIVAFSFEKRYSRGEAIFNQGEKCNFFYIVSDGLVKVSICSFSGNRLTYLLAGSGEPLNIVGAFTGAPRLISAVAFNEAKVLKIKRKDFLAYAFKHPTIITNIIAILGNAVDSANDKLIDMIEKKVEERLIKVLYTLQQKFGQRLRFTSHDFAELAGTTTESTLRAMARFRARGIIKSGRGEVIILEPEQVRDFGSQTYWV